MEALFQKLQEQHQTELQQLEERLKDFYSAEWDKTHEAYQREADKCRALMQQQVGSYLDLPLLTSHISQVSCNHVKSALITQYYIRFIVSAFSECVNHFFFLCLSF